MANGIVHEVVNLSDVDLASESASDFEPVNFKDTKNTFVKLAAVYIELINDEIEKKDVASSGRMQDKIKPTKLQVNGDVLSIGINALEYTSYVDEGVNGWAVDRGSRFNYTTKGVDPDGEMVKSLKDYIRREGSSARNVKASVTSRERKGQAMPDPTTSAAVSMAYMIKRQGIKPRHFWRDATERFIPIFEDELSAALRVDIINNITK
jgi:hypothetical protein